MAMFAEARDLPVITENVSDHMSVSFLSAH